MTEDKPLIEHTLELLEDALQVDVERGESSSAEWRSNVKQRVDELAAVFAGETLPRHEQEFDDIRKEDIVLQPRIETMQDEDRRITASIEGLQASVEAVAEHAALTEQQVSEITDEVQTLVADVRKQRREITKWFSESLLRDRGFSS